jgi:hypothetical protein
LRPTNAIIPYLPDSVDIIKNKVVFEINDSSGVVKAYLNEEIRWSHDPNQLQATHICKNRNKIRYKGHFYNDQDFPSEQLALELKLPYFLDKTTLKIDSLIINCSNVLCSDDPFEIIIIDDTLRVLLNGRFSIKGYQEGKCNGRVDYSFCVEALSNINADEELDLEIEGNTVFHFESSKNRYEIEYIPDSVKYFDDGDGGKWYRLLENDCTLCNRECATSPPCDWLCKLIKKLRDWRWWPIVIIPIILLIGVPKWLKRRNR